MKTSRLFSIVAMLTLCLTSITLQAQAQQLVSQSTNPNDTSRGLSELQFTNLVAQARPNRRRPFFLTSESWHANAGGAASGITPLAAAPSLPVTGGGTLGRLTKWTGFTGSNSAIGDTTIYEDKFGKVGIGTDSPASKLTVAGMIQSTIDGFKFPDGTVQTSSAAAALFSVAHDTTLLGDGTTSAPLGVNVPLKLTGPGNPAEVVSVTATGSGGSGMSVEGGPGGRGMFVRGGKASNDADEGVFAIGGEATSGRGGAGLEAIGGLGNNGDGGLGVRATGGTGRGAGNRGGNGIVGFAGSGVIGATDGLAGRFVGDVEVTGKLTVTSGMKMFHIDHPLDPENKYLNHAAIESSEVLNVYSGNVATDANGDAIVALPDWFEALNKDYRYQLTVMGTFAQAIVADEIQNNRFAIKTNAPNVRVSWQVTGVRSDPTARKFKFDVEEEKSERERGYYLNPDAFGQPEEKSVNWAHDREGMIRLKQRRIEAEQMRVRQPNQP